VATTTASYVDTSPLPSVTSTPPGVSSSEVTLAPRRIVPPEASSAAATFST
jgi:hypothetical protein